MVSPTEAADPTTGYVSGQFSRTKGANFAFIIKSIDSGKDFTMALGEDSSLPQAVSKQTVAIKLPPGQYKVTRWITYATLTKEVITRQDIANAVLSKPFTIDAGTVTHLGSFDLIQTRTFGYPSVQLDFVVEPRPVKQLDMQNAFMLTYPLIAKQKFRCQLCIDTVGTIK